MSREQQTEHLNPSRPGMPAPVAAALRPAPSSRRRLVAAAFVALALALISLGVIIAASASAGAYVYTDGAKVRVSKHAAPVRSVLWEPSEPVPGAFPATSDEYEPRVSADGATMVFVRGKPGENADLFLSRLTPSGWTAPAPIEAVNTAADELGAELSRDGERLYFYSDREGGMGGYDLWVSRREVLSDGPWEAPINLGPGVNSPFNEYGPALTPDATRLFFASNRPRPGEPAPIRDAWSATIRENRARHDYDLFESPLGPSGAGPANAVAPLNTTADEGAPAVSPAGDFLYFSSDRPSSLGGFDLFRVRLASSGFGAVENVGDAVNSAADDMDPALSADGFRLFFSSNRETNRERTSADESSRAAASAPATNHTAPPADPPGIADQSQPRPFRLWGSVSREVYLEREPPSGPSLSDLLGTLWPWFLLLLLLALLAYLLSHLLRSATWRRRFGRLSLLAQCLLLSLALHMLVAGLLALWRVGSEIGEFLRQSGGTRVVLASAGPAGDAAAQIRGAFVSHDPAAMPVEMTLARPDAHASEPLIEPVALEFSPAVPLPVPHQADIARDTARSRPDAAAQPAEPTAPSPITPALALQTPAPAQPDAPANEATRPAPSLDAHAVESTRPELAPRIAPAPVVDSELPTAPSMPTDSSASAIPASIPPARSRAAGQAPPISSLPEPAARPAPASVALPAASEPSPAASPEPSIDARSADAVRGDTSPHPRPQPAPVEIPGGDAIDAASLARRVRTALPVRAESEPVAAGVDAPIVRRAAAASASEAAADAPSVRLASNLPAVIVPATPALPAAEAPQASRDTPNVSSAPAVALSLPALSGSPRPRVAPSPREPGDMKHVPSPTDRAALAATSPSDTAADAVAAVVGAPSVRPARAVSAPASSNEPALRMVVELPSTGPSAPPALPAVEASEASRNAPEAANTTAVALNLSAPSGAPRPGIAMSPRTPGEMPHVNTPTDLAAFPAAAPAGAAPAAAVVPRAGPAGGATSRPGFVASDAPPLRAPSALTRPTTEPLAARLPPEEAPIQPKETFAQRDPEIRSEVLEKMGGSNETEQAVGRALTWFLAHQEPDGRWTGRHFDDRCGQCGSPADFDSDGAMTGIVLLCFLGAGHTHTGDGPYAEEVSRAINWLLARQEPSGDLRQGETMYSQTVATVALCEALAMTRDARLTAPTRRAVAFLESNWRSRPSRDSRAEQDNTAVLGWQVMAMESARRAGITVSGATFDAAATWLNYVADPRAPGRYSYRRGEAPSAAMTAEAMFVRQLQSASRDEPAMRQSAAFILQTPPKWNAARSARAGADVPTYYWYYATLALFQHQGEAWKAWNDALVPALLGNQHKEGAKTGSWDPQDPWSRLGGRIYQTAICTLSLEVYYRYKPAGADPASPASIPTPTASPSSRR